MVQAEKHRHRRKNHNNSNKKPTIIRIKDQGCVVWTEKHMHISTQLIHSLERTTQIYPDEFLRKT